MFQFRFIGMNAIITIVIHSLVNIDIYNLNNKNIYVFKRNDNVIRKTNANMVTISQLLVYLRQPQLPSCVTLIKSMNTLWSYVSIFILISVSILKHDLNAKRIDHFNFNILLSLIPLHRRMKYVLRYLNDMMCIFIVNFTTL